MVFRVFINLLIISVVFLANAYAVPNDVFNKSFTQLVEQDINSLSPEKDPTSANVAGRRGGTIEDIHLNRGNPCTGGICSTTSEDDAEIQPGKRKIPLSALIPGSKKMMADSMNSSDLVTMSAQNVTSQLTVQMATLGLVESSVHEAVRSATTLAAQQNSLMLQTQSNTAALSNKFDNMDFYLRAYIECINSKMQGTPKLGYADAVSVCSEDSTVSTPNSFVGPTQGFNFADDPNHKANSVTGYGSDMLGNEISVISYIVNQEKANPVGGAISIPSDFGESFQEYFGDVVFELTLSPTGDRQASFYVKNSTTAPATKYFELINETYKSWKALIKGHSNCLKASETGMPLNELKQKLKEVSVPGLPINTTVVNAFGSRINADIKLRGISCASVDLSSSVDDDLKKKEYQVQLWRNVFYLSRLTALAKYLSIAALAEQVINHTTFGSSMSSEVKPLAKNLIYRAVGTEDPRASLVKVHDQLYKFLEYLFSDLDRQALLNEEKSSQMFESAQQAGKRPSGGGQ